MPTLSLALALVTCFTLQFQLQIRSTKRKSKSRTGFPAGEVPRDSLLLPGSFNPVHEGHEEMGRQAAKMLERSFDSIFLELCVVNADKGAVDVATLCSRITKAALRGNRVLATRAMLFQDKADLFPGCDFVVGYDTYRRILNPKYYAPAGAKADSSPEEQSGWVAEALQRLQSKNVRFIVAGRVDADIFRTLEADPVMDLPQELSDMFLSLPDFRNDISSTAIRLWEADKTIQSLIFKKHLLHCRGYGKALAVSIGS
eukprot:s304_g10.t1